MRDLSKLLWCDLKNDEERIEFLLSGRACDTGIIAPVVIPVVVDLFKRAKKYERAYSKLWDGITDVLTEDQIIRIEKLYSKELNVLGVL